jgi:hypothetical protein
MQPPEPLELEHESWRAACEGQAFEFYDRVMAHNARIFLPDRHFPRQRALQDWARTLRWSRYELFDEQTMPLTEGIMVVSYRVTAQHRDEPPAATWRAFCRSLYVRQEAGWRLTLHQRYHLPADTAAGTL